jgi:peptidyl-prolyl cis-trans isomerase C
VMHKPGADMPFDELYPGVVGMLIKKQALVLRAQQNGQDEDPDTKRRMKAAAEDVLTSAYIDRIAKKRITEQVLLDRYALDYVGKPGPAEVRLRIILTPTEQEAQAVIAELKGGTDFAALARRASHDASRSNGGDVGYQRREALLPEIAAVAFALQPGQTTAYPVHITDGWCIVRIEDRHQTSQPAFASVRERLLAVLVRETFQKETEDALSTFRVSTFSISGREKESEESK